MAARFWVSRMGMEVHFGSVEDLPSVSEADLNLPKKMVVGLRHEEEKSQKARPFHLAIKIGVFLRKLKVLTSVDGLVVLELRMGR